MKQLELKGLVKKALLRNRASIETLKGNDNPQVKEIYQSISGQVTALEAVFEALNDNKIALNILAY